MTLLFLVFVYFNLMTVFTETENSESVKEIDYFKNISAKLGKSKTLFDDTKGLKKINSTILYDYQHHRMKRKAIVPDYSHPLAIRLQYIGYFLAAHKYFELDRRYIISATKGEKPVFFKHFPLPSLRRLNPQVQRACDTGFLECVDEIYKIARVSESLFDFHKIKVNSSRPPEFYPFKYARELFNYRTSASYYMCWYTMREEQPLKDIGIDHCFKYFNYASENKKNTVNDFRAADGRKSFQCALLWFCPNQCYGKFNGNTRSLREALAEKTNPCVDLTYKDCIVPRNKNTNFEDLKKNRLNVSCYCGNGIEWNTKFSMCIDTDECYNKQDDCWKRGFVCQNTKGSYKCRCRLGFSYNEVTQKCEMNEILHPGASKSLKTRKRKTHHDKTFSEKFQIWFGVLSGSHKISPTFELLLMLVFVVSFCL